MTFNVLLLWVSFLTRRLVDLALKNVIFKLMRWSRVTKYLTNSASLGLTIT